MPPPHGCCHRVKVTSAEWPSEDGGRGNLKIDVSIDSATFLLPRVYHRQVDVVDLRLRFGHARREVLRRFAADTKGGDARERVAGKTTRLLRRGIWFMALLMS